MTTEAMQIAIGLHLGWEFSNRERKRNGRPCGWTSPHCRHPDRVRGHWRRMSHCPNWPRDLNAMHEAVVKCIVGDDTKEFNYRCHLDKICGHDRSLAPFASADQCAEAFLRTFGLWTKS